MITPFSRLESYRKAILPPDLKDTTAGVVTVAALSVIASYATQPFLGRAPVVQMLMRSYGASLVWFSISQQAPEEMSFYPKFLNNQARQVFRRAYEIWCYAYKILRDERPPST